MRLNILLLEMKHEFRFLVRVSLAPDSTKDLLNASGGDTSFAPSLYVALYPTRAPSQAWAACGLPMPPCMPYRLDGTDIGESQ